MKKAFSFMMAVLTLVLCAAGVHPASIDLSDYDLWPRFPFRDVPYTEWYFEPIWYASEHELMNGIGEETFGPSTGMTRAEFVTVLCRLSDGELDSAAGSGAFGDVAVDSWYAGYIGWGYKNNVINGFEDGTFRPDDRIIRQEMITALDRYLGACGYALPDSATAPESFTDADSVPEWAAGHLESLRRSGLIAGDDGGRFNPGSTMTRAEAATVLMRLDGSIAVATAPDYHAWGAYSLLCSLTGFTADGDAAADGSGTYPLLKVNTQKITLDMSALYVSPAAYPIMKIASYGMPDKATVSVGGSASSVNVSSDGELKTLTVNLADIYKDEMSYETDVTIDFGAACGVSVLYVSFSKSAEIASTLTPDTLADTLRYNPMSEISYEEATDAVIKSCEDAAQKRIDEIMSADGIDPSTIEGQCYYISSVNGDDSNNGLTPQTPWKTVDKLYKVLGNGTVRMDVPKAGDGVFFERGSKFYGSDVLATNGGGKNALTIVPGVTYSAYGEGDKPLFTHELQMSSPAGKWIPVEGYENLWQLDEELPYKSDVPEYYEIGAVIVNSVSDPEHVMWGIRSSVYDESFAHQDQERGLVTNGRDVFTTDANYTGFDCLKNNLQFHYDKTGPALYMYCTDGNPGEVFGDIKLSLFGDIIGGGGDAEVEGTVVDNLSVKYGSRHGMAVEGDNLTVQNCEIGWIGGCDIGNGIENFGGVTNYTIQNCYLYQCYDDCITSQYAGTSSQNGAGQLMKNVTMKDNVLTHTTAAIELWSYTSGKDGSEVTNTDMGQTNIIKDSVVSGNYGMYLGYGFGHQRYREYGKEKYGCFLEASGFHFQQFSNVEMTDNVIIHANCANDIMQIHTPGVGSATTSVRGIVMKNNTYIMTNRRGYLQTDLDSRVPRAIYPYNPETVAYFASLGIESGSKFYYYDRFTFPQEENGLYK